MDATQSARDRLETLPANRSMGLVVVRAVDGFGEVSIDTAPAQHNVIGAMHSSGLITLADAAGLAALISALDTPERIDTLLPLGSAAAMEFRAPARGRLIATCRIGDDGLLAVHRLTSGEQHRIRMSTSAEIRDVSGAVVATGRFDWNVRLTSSVA